MGITAIFYCRAWQASSRQASTCGHIGFRLIAGRMLWLKFWTSGRYAPGRQASAGSRQAPASITGSRQVCTCGHIGFRLIAGRVLGRKFWTSGRYAPGGQASASITGSRPIARRMLWLKFSGRAGKRPRAAGKHLRAYRLPPYCRTNDLAYIFPLRISICIS